MNGAAQPERQLSGAAAPFEIGLQRTLIATPADVWRNSFATLPAFAFETVIAPDAMARLVSHAANAVYADDDVQRVGVRQVETPQKVSAAINLMLGRRTLFEWLEQATGCGPIKAVAGRIAQTRAGTAEHLGWHDDRDVPGRLLAIVLNLSDRPYHGGEFELRRKGESEPLFRFTHSQPGSLTVFAVRPDLEHRVLPVVDGGPRRVFAGWLLREPESGVRSVFA